MARQAPSHSKGLLAVLTVWILSACRPSTEASVAVPHRFVSADQPGWQQRNGQLWRADTLFSGWQFALHPLGDTLFVGAFWQGKPQGTHRQWYANGQLKEVRHYVNGWQEGQQRGWHESGHPAFAYQFRHDVYEGRVRDWYPNGKPARDGQYQEGQEVGPQRQWYADGSLKVNYVVRAGRTYGFTGVKTCVNVWDSIDVAH